MILEHHLLSNGKKSHGLEKFNIFRTIVPIKVEEARPTVLVNACPIIFDKMVKKMISHLSPNLMPTLNYGYAKKMKKAQKLQKMLMLPNKFSVLPTKKSITYSNIVTKRTYAVVETAVYYLRFPKHNKREAIVPKKHHLKLRMMP